MAKGEARLAGATVDRDVWGDPRYPFLAELLGHANHYETIARMTLLWATCTALKTDIPPRAKIAVCLGKAHAPEALVEADLAELMQDGMIRVKGCDGRTEWYEEQSERGQAGGKARAAEAPRAGGRFVAKADPPATDQQVTSEPPAAPATDQPVTSPHQPKIKDQDQNKDQILCESAPPARRARTGARSHTAKPTGQPIPEGWAPSPSDENTFAVLELKTAGVDVDLELRSFHAWAKRKSITSDDWDATWFGFVAQNNKLRESRAQKQASDVARAARDRERHELATRAQQAEADREEVAAIARAAVTNGFQEPRKATG